MHHQKTSFFSIFPKGLAMGTADVIPGVSGGTLALLLGIYERFIGALKNISPTLVRELWHNRRITNTEKRRACIQALRQSDCLFLVYLLSGMGCAIAIASKTIPHFMVTHTPETLSLFVGLIVPSISVPFIAMKQRGAFQWISLALGVCLAVSSSLIMQHYGTLIDTSYSFGATALITGISATIAICAMILPGISGSYLLLLLGQYFFVLGIVGRLLNDIAGTTPTQHADALLLVERFSTPEVGGLAICFGCGALLGLVCFSRVINWALGHFHDSTMGALTGMVLGSLYVLWPFKTTPPESTLQALHIAVDEKVKWLPMATNYIPALHELGWPTLYFCVGICLSYGLIAWGTQERRA